MSSARGIEVDWVHAVSAIPEHGLDQVRDATSEQRAALAAILDILAVESLRVSYRLEPMPRGRFKLTGELKARVVQACVVTLDPVATDVAEAVEVEFWPAGAVPVPDATEQTILDAPEHEPIEAQRLAVGRVLAETLAAALPAFPRTAEAELEQREAGPADGGSVSPFAALADWKPKEE